MDIQSVRDVAPASPAQHGAAPKPAHAAAAPIAPNGGAAAPDAQEHLAQAVKHINKAMESMAPGIEFSIDEQLHTTVVKVVDVTTREVLRQMPSAETLEIAKALDKLQGLLIRQQA
jgi:flagellar protein FlaG